ncbi:citryl-CoA lyase [Orrella sp. 11846]|uniref:citryl-CoA lyase n=1 Tax=Orrella sp. 11846 TaxID=3409913 RepID=UPI003B599BBB
MSNTPKTELCEHTLTSMHYRDRDLVEELIGHSSFSEVMFAQIMGRRARAVDLRIMDAVLVTLMEHGLTPSAIATRVTYMSAPENLQGAVASGLMCVGSQFVGTMENCAVLLSDIMAHDNPEQRMREIVTDYRARKAPLPGFGHHLHKPDDPRSIKLFEVAAEEPEFDQRYVDTIRAFNQVVDEIYGRHITINATGAVAALLGGIGVPVELMRGFAVISRAAGLVAHIAEEQRSPSGRFIWETIDAAIPFVHKSTDL